MPYVEPSPSHWHALLIAIAYQSHPDDRARLDQPHADVHLMRELLTKKGYPPENIVVLSDEKSSPPGAQPTKENILNALSHFYDPVLPPSDPAQSHKFFFYYAGHGAQEFDKTLTEDDWLNECIVPLGSRVLLALGLMEPEPEMYWAGACTGSRPRPLDPGEAGLVHSPPASPTVLVPALLPLPSLASLPSPPTTTSHPTHPSQPNAAHPPRRKLTKPKRRQSSIKFLPSDCPFGMEPVDLPPRTRGGDGSAGAGGVGGAQGMPGAYGAGFPAGGPEQGQGQGQGQLVLPVVTGEHGWINDDTLCDLLCRRLPENCKLIAVFDMCHSGTALDLPKNYTWEDVPWLHLWRFNLVDAYLSRAERERGGKDFLYNPKPAAKGDSVHPEAPTAAGAPKPQPQARKPRLRCMKSSLAILQACKDSTGIADIHLPASMAERAAWSEATMRRAVKRWLHTHRRGTSDPVVPSARSVEPTILVNPAEDEHASGHAAPPAIADKEPLSPRSALHVHANLPHSPYSAAGSLRTPSTPQLTPSSEGRSIGLPEAEVEASSLQGDPSYLSPGFRTDEGESESGSFTRPRSASAPPLMPLPLPLPSKPPIIGEIVCLGASHDSQVSSDKQSLAKLLIELHSTFPNDPTHYQLLLWVTRNAAKRQTPQLSASRELADHWDGKFRV